MVSVTLDSRFPNAPEPAFMSSESALVDTPARSHNKRRAANHRRPMSMPLSERDYSSLEIPPDFTKAFALVPQLREETERPRQLAKRSPGVSTRLAWCFSLMLGTASLYVLFNTHFDITRALLPISFSIGFLPFVRPCRWLTKTLFRISLWTCSFLLAFRVQATRYAHYFLVSLTQEVRKKTKAKTSPSEMRFVVQSVVGMIALYFFMLEIPFLRIVRFVFRLLRAFVLLQYYMALLTGLELMIYLRVDYILGVMGAAWFRWAVQRVWSVMTWVDIILAMSPSAYYYLHLSMSEQ